jgi:putative transposase
VDGRGVGWAEQQRLCAQLAKEYPFVAKLHSNARQASADRAWRAISRFYANCKSGKPGKKGYPRFQHDNRSVEYKVGGWRLEPDGKHLTFTDGTGIGMLRLIGTRSIETFPLPQIKRADGYYVQFAVATARALPHEPTGRQVGIDIGLKSFYADSDGGTVPNPRFLRRAGKKLKCLHRSKDRKQKGSKNRNKAIKRLAKGYLKVQRQRQDFACKQARALIISHDMIAFEDLQIANLVKNHRPAKSISDAAWGQFLQWLRCYGSMAGVPVIAVSPRFTSQDCSGCGERVQKSLSVRTHVCPGCGLVLDRDHNAALNILDAALRTAGQAGTGTRKSTNASGQGTAGPRKQLRAVKSAG